MFNLPSTKFQNSEILHYMKMSTIQNHTYQYLNYQKQRHSLRGNGDYYNTVYDIIYFFNWCVNI